MYDPANDPNKALEAVVWFFFLVPLSILLIVGVGELLWKFIKWLRK